VASGVEPRPGPARDRQIIVAAPGESAPRSVSGSFPLNAEATRVEATTLLQVPQWAANGLERRPLRTEQEPFESGIRPLVQMRARDGPPSVEERAQEAIRWDEVLGPLRRSGLTHTAGVPVRGEVRDLKVVVCQYATDQLGRAVFKVK
jgi:hypothetical protein